MSILALRRVSTIYSSIHPFTSFQYRFKSKQSNDDKSKPKSSRLNEELLRFEGKSSQTSRDVSRNYGMEDRRNLNVKHSNTQNKSDTSTNQTKLARPFESKERKQIREKEQTGQKEKKIRPQVILDTESDEVKVLTRQVADSLTPAHSPNESSNIEQELLDVLRGHRIISKNMRRIERKFERRDTHVQTKSSVDQEKPLPKTKQAPQSSTTNIDKTTDAFSALLRDFQLTPVRASPKSKFEDDLVQDERTTTRSRFNEEREQKRDSGEKRKPSRDGKRRQEFLRPHRLWTGDSLGIFTGIDMTGWSSKASAIWEKYEQDELTRISTIPPRNAFEEMIQWTNDGILWKFPINNEQDVGPDADVPFYEHVLLERHLHGFPDSPLIRQFMELVCIGLGRNPYWTVEQKISHINWFRKYFNEKAGIFNETVHTGGIKSSTAPPVVKPASTYKPKPPPPPPTPKVVPVAATPTAKAPATASKN